MGRAAATWCCVSILTAIITSRLDPCIALLGHRNDASFFGSTLDADRPGRRKGGAHVPSIERWSMAPGDKVQWSVPGTGTDKRGESWQNLASTNMPPGGDDPEWMSPSDYQKEQISFKIELHCRLEYGYP